MRSVSPLISHMAMDNAKQITHYTQRVILAPNNDWSEQPNTKPINLFKKYSAEQTNEHSEWDAKALSERSSLLYEHMHLFHFEQINISEFTRSYN